MEAWLRNIILGNEFRHLVINFGISEDWWTRPKHQWSFYVTGVPLGSEFNSTYTVRGWF